MKSSRQAQGKLWSSAPRAARPFDFAQGKLYTQNFDTENRITSVVVGGQTTTFVYDGDGNLIKRVGPDEESSCRVQIEWRMGLPLSRAI